MELRDDAGELGAGARAVLALARFNGVILSVCRVIVIWLVGALAMIVGAAVIFRYGFNNSLAWAEDAAKFLMVWMTFIGAPLGFRHGSHVSIELLPPLPRVAKQAIRLVVHLIVLFVMAILAWYGWTFAWNGRTQVALTIGDISMFWIFVCMPIGAAVMALIALEQVLRVLVGLPEIELVDHEEMSTRGI